jgi:molybdopterin converting factor subunit 1
MLHVKIKLFGSVREAAGSSEIIEEVADGASVADLRAQLSAVYPLIEKYGSHLRVAVNCEMADEGSALSEGDEVALLPPVSGGAARCSISSEALDVMEVIARVSADDSGGISTFLGAVRDHNRGHSIHHLEYEAYPEMAVREMEKISDEAAQKWPGVRVAIAHRVGSLAIGDLAVVIAAAGHHRAEAFESCRFAIDVLKERVPIWKKEVATDGEYWVEDHA